MGRWVPPVAWPLLWSWVMSGSRSAIVNVLSLLLSLVGGVGTARAGGSLSQDTAEVRRRLDVDQGRGQSVRLTPRSRQVAHPGITKRVFPARVEETGQKVFARIPRYGVQGAMRRHNFARVVAEQLGWGYLVPPAEQVTLAENVGDGTIDIRGLVRNVRKGDPIMLVEDLGQDWMTHKEFEEAGRASTVASAFPEELRLNGAVLHLLSWQLDGNLANVMVRAGSGRALTPKDVRILDHDVSLGIKHTGPRINGSAFFPGNPVSKSIVYTSKQTKFEHLPPQAQKLVGSLARASIQEIGDAYGLERDEAALVSKAAKDIHDLGLTKAIEKFWAESPSYHDTDYHQRKKRGRR